MKDHLSNFTAGLAAVASFLLLLYFVTSPLIFLNTHKGPAASPFLLKLAGPVVYVLESDFRRPTLWYFGLWGVEIVYNEREPAPQPPWYATPAYVFVGTLSFGALVYPLWRSRRSGNRGRCERFLVALPWRS